MSCRAVIRDRHVYGDVNTVCGKARLRWGGDCHDCGGFRLIAAQIVGYNCDCVVITEAVIIIIMCWVAVGCGIV